MIIGYHYLLKKCFLFFRLFLSGYLNLEAVLANEEQVFFGDNLYHPFHAVLFFHPQRDVGYIAFLEVLVQCFGGFGLVPNEFHEEVHLLVGDDDGLQARLAEDADVAVVRTAAEGFQIVTHGAEEIVVGQQVDSAMVPSVLVRR